MKHTDPPRFISHFLHLFLPLHRAEELEGDLDELFQQRVNEVGLREARWRYMRDVVSLLRPSLMRRGKACLASTTTNNISPKPTHTTMLRNYLKIAFRNLAKNQVYSFINIFGLASGMAVAMLIGLWLYDELSFNRQFKKHDRLAMLWQFVKFDVEKVAYDIMAIPLAQELRSHYPDFESVALSKSRDVIVAAGDRKLLKTGNYVEPEFIDMLSLNVLSGTRFGNNDVNSILLSKSLAQALFDTRNPLNKLIKLDNKQTVKVAGVYEDFPANSTFDDVMFLVPWKFYAANDENAKRDRDEWDSNSYQIFVQLKPGADFRQVSTKIKDIRMKRDNPPGYKPEFYLHPMSRWHLYSDFKDGINTGGLITFVWLFGSIGVIVLLLACINFMNLSTARSEKRAKEVGIRKAIGSLRTQLIAQFFSESLLMALLAFAVSILFVQFTLPFFNQVAEKKMTILWADPLFWLAGLGFSLLTGLIAGSYPALYLSSFQPVKVLKGIMRTSRSATIPRRVLVGFQFTVSVTLIIGTIIVFRQIEHAKDRPVGYSRSGLIEIGMNAPELYGHYTALRDDLLNTGAVADMSESSNPITVQAGGTTDISWKGKKPGSKPLVMTNYITHDYGKTVGWQIKEGRDFSRAYSTDTASVILNEAAVKLMGFKNPIGEIVRRGSPNRQFKVIGVVKDMIKEDPFRPVSPSFFAVEYGNVNTINIRLAPQLSTNESLAKVEQVFKRYSPDSPFDYKFADEQYDRKFGAEQRVGRLAGGFTILAILISCLGLFGLASFMAEQRTKEIGIRKVLGASVFNVWQLLSKEFVILVVIAFCLATPLAYYLLSDWLQSYQYRTELSWWVFALSGFGVLTVTLLTVSFQSIKAALMNPVRSLRSE
ncbi:MULTISPECIES: ABC transporter permease [unclassified Spirosoma]|uniref:ABC transporter permease n=1 Tax=unclassified Spirosoma TaxID=2621999 RepID=UPI00095FF508|nr:MULTISPECIES: ABC transporter permease [unclassified Spirosoma]MBN8820962.1 ABC transporter permease [Spirosoma sp.]OJW75971.1 MAG: ABC transporter permease [Spirosoma sp. 48-14]